jgi:hypothetical protein
MQWWKYVAAAVVIAAMVFTGKLLLSPIEQSLPVAKVDIKPPSANRAMIIMGDGKTIYLDSSSNGQLASIDGMKVEKLADGRITYIGATDEVQYNTFINPRNSKIGDITLIDGTRVWLNSGSSITYPTAFVGGKRTVTLKGEGYFDVAHDEKKPFIVNARGTDIQVYGTEFNLNAYDDNSELKVTLVKGSVGVTNNQQKQMIVPGEQAVVKDNIRVAKDVDIDEVTAWKSGSFSFSGQSIDEIMKQFARWYDVEIVMQGDIKQDFTIINASKDVPISKLLKGLETTGGVHFEIQERKIIVKP